MIYIIILVIIIIYYIRKTKIKIKFKTFFKRGFKVDRGVFGIYCYVGMQGQGKTYSCAEYVFDNYNHCQIFSNITFFNIDYVHYSGFKEMLELRDKLDYALLNNRDYIIFHGKKVLIDPDKQILFIYDELFSELGRGSKIDNDVLDFISQMRKRKYILLTTCQIWSDIPITWRRLTRYEIDCNMRRFLGINILVKVFRDGENMKWSNDEQEHIAPLISTTVTHTRMCVSRIYDTFERIHNKNSNFNLIPSEQNEVEQTPESAREFDHEFWEEDSISELEEDVPLWKK